MSLYRHSFRLLTRHAPVHRSLAGNLHLTRPSFAAGRTQSQIQRTFATGGRRREEKKPSDGAVPTIEMINAAEKHMKQMFGDHATWDHEKLLALTYVDLLLAPQDFAYFYEYAVGGYKPGGGRPSFPLITQEELGLMEMPYHNWAPAPYNHLKHCLMEKVLPLFGSSDASSGLKEEMVPCATWHARLRALKVKIWNGMVPMTREHWLERKMDDPQNYRNLFELMQDILNIFQWLNQEQIHDRMRLSFNWLVDQHTEFEEAANLLREQRGVAERLNLAGMWAEYYQSVVSTMSGRTRQWLVDRVDEVQTRAFQEYNSSLERAGTDEEAIATAGRKYYECVQDLNSLISQSEYVVDFPMAGFKGYTPSNNLSDLPLHVRKDVCYSKIGASLSWKWQEVMLNAEDEDNKVNPPKQQTILDLNDEVKNGRPPAPPRFRNKEALIGHYHEGKRNRIAMRRALRGERKPLAEEYWISILKERMEFYLNNGRDRKTHRWGFACYRLTYKQTDAEWADFKKKLEADVFQSGQWIEGFDTISDMAGLEFIDGREVGIAEGDIEAAKKHFKSTYTMLPTLGRLWTNDFLVIDHQSYTSYTSPEPSPEKRQPLPFGPCFGNNGGHVRLIDTLEYDPEMIDATSPGYEGELKVLSSLVLTELYPVLASNVLRPPSLWVNARLHPKGVWVGHTTQSQDAWWEWQRIDHVAMLRGFLDSMRGKVDGKNLKDGT